MHTLYAFFGLYALVGTALGVVYAKPIAMIVGLGAEIVRYEAPRWMSENVLRMMTATIYFVLMIFTWPLQLERLERLR